ncbi:MAG: hypothetical protein ACUVXB_17485 [Bryobacteraceae bacterium]
MSIEGMKEASTSRFPQKSGWLICGYLSIAVGALALSALGVGCARKSRQDHQGDLEQVVDDRLQALARLFDVSFASRTIWFAGSDVRFRMKMQRYDRGKPVGSPVFLGWLPFPLRQIATLCTAAMPDGCDPGSIKVVISFPELGCSWMRELHLPASWREWVLAVSSEVVDLESDVEVPLAAVYEGPPLNGDESLIPISWLASAECDRGALVVFVERRGELEERR